MTDEQKEPPSFEPTAEPPKPAFEPKDDALFEIDEKSKKIPLPSRKTMLIAGGVLGVILIGFLLFSFLGGEEEKDARPAQSPEERQAITGAVENFYSVLASSPEDACSLFLDGVFDPDSPEEACQRWQSETFSSPLEVTGPIEIKKKGTRALALYKLKPLDTPEEGTPAPDASAREGGADTGAPLPESNPGGAGEATDKVGTPPGETLPAAPTGEALPEKTAPTGEALPEKTAQSGEPLPGETAPTEEAPGETIPDDLGQGITAAEELQGGTVLIEEDGQWKIATLAGLAGSGASDSELEGTLAEEYDLLGQGPLYNLPDPPPEDLPKVDGPKTPTAPKETPSDRLSCPAPQRFDLVADIRSGDFNLFGEQSAASGGDIIKAKHSSKPNESCLSVSFRDNYKSVENLSLRLSHNSWQSTARASFELSFASGVPEGTIKSGSRQRPVQIEFDASSDGKQIRVLFPTPPEWRGSAPRQFWFLRSQFQDPLGSGGQLFDEGRPAGQIAPANAKNLEGGWPF